MIKHIVMWKLKDYAEGQNKYQNAILIKNSLENLKEYIKDIKEIEVGININDSRQAYDVVLYSVFESKKGLDNYVNHERHEKISDFISKVREKRIVVDYEI